MPEKTAVMIEGRKAFRRFDSAMGTILSVSKEEMLRREEAYKRQVELNPNKRGPKSKLKSAS